MSNVLIIGAASAIATGCARIFAERGDSLFLVARSGERLDTLAADLKTRGAPAVGTQQMDSNDFAGHDAMMESAAASLGSIDILLIAHGSLSDQQLCERDPDAMRREMDTNAISACALMALAANRFEARKAGTIAVISSVAGDRGRASNYVYGSAKAMVSAFASGLRQRLHSSNVAVVTIKPGFVDTPMTAAFRKGPLWADPGKVARAIIRAIDRRAGEVYVPGFWWLIMTIIKAIPTSVFKRLKL